MPFSALRPLHFLNLKLYYNKKKKKKKKKKYFLFAMWVICSGICSMRDLQIQLLHWFTLITKPILTLIFLIWPLFRTETNKLDSFISVISCKEFYHVVIVQCNH
jgi:uncharacterized membrane protein